MSPTVHSILPRTSEGTPDASSTAFRLGAFTIAPELGTISSAAATTRVEPKVMAVLLELVRRADRLTTKDDLLDAVWADTAVVEAVLTRCVCLLRRALGDDRRLPRYIETVPKRGYRLVASVEPVRRPAAAAAATPCVAVLPFRRHGPSTRWRSEDAAADLLASRLAQSPSVRLVSRATTASVGRAGAALPELALALGADLLVEGAVVCGDDGAQLVLAQLFDGAADRSLWSGERRTAAGDDPLAFGAAVRELADELASQVSRGARAPCAPPRVRLVAT